MRRGLLFLWVLFLSFGFGPKDPGVSGTEQSWSGGMCCRKGTNYVLHFKIKTSKTKKLKVNSVCIDGKMFREIAVKTNIEEGFTQYELRFDYITDERTDPNYTQTGQPELPFYENCNNSGIYFNYSNKKGVWKIAPLQKLEPIAYP